MSGTVYERTRQEFEVHFGDPKQFQDQVTVMGRKVLRNLSESCRENESEWLSESRYQKAYCWILYWMSPTIISSVLLFGEPIH
uniref:ABC transporter C family member 8-like n=1 Tax=Tanacetum cinerariifolium TaxID=118510 RepID=A0A6L2LWC0_TANCI|nr:ABC transporter C family member 8-like [Tanacetum cinerariifolium]